MRASMVFFSNDSMESVPLMEGNNMAAQTALAISR
jgi:hypothetical protein